MPMATPAAVGPVRPGRRHRLLHTETPAVRSPANDVAFQEVLEHQQHVEYRHRINPCRHVDLFHKSEVHARHHYGEGERRSVGLTFTKALAERAQAKEQRRCHQDENDHEHEHQHERQRLDTVRQDHLLDAQDTRQEEEYSYHHARDDEQVRDEGHGRDGEELAQNQGTARNGRHNETLQGAPLLLARRDVDGRIHAAHHGPHGDKEGQGHPQDAAAEIIVCRQVMDPGDTQRFHELGGQAPFRQTFGYDTGRLGRQLQLNPAQRVHGSPALRLDDDLEFHGGVGRLIGLGGKNDDLERTVAHELLRLLPFQFRPINDIDDARRSEPVRQLGCTGSAHEHHGRQGLFGRFHLPL